MSVLVIYLSWLVGVGDGGKSLDVYLPAVLWYNWFTMAVVSNGISAMTLKDLSAPLDYLPVSSEQ